MTMFGSKATSRVICYMSLIMRHIDADASLIYGKSNINSTGVQSQMQCKNLCWYVLNLFTSKGNLIF